MSNRTLTALRQIGPRLILRGLVLIAVLAAAGLAANRYGFEDLIAALDFSDDPQAGWLHGRVAFVAVGAGFTAIGGPRQAVAFFAAYFFGAWPGLFLALTAAGCGAAATYLFATLFRDAAERMIRGRVDVARQIWAQHAFSLTLIIRLLPVGSNFLANLAAGAARIPPGSFFAGSLVGYVPQTLVFALLGAGVNIGSGEQIALSIALFVVSAVLGVWVYANYRRRLRNAGREA